MYDKMLETDIKEYRKNITNTVYTQPYFADIKKILNNRTNDKLYFLNYLFTNNLIEAELFEDLYEKVKEDYNTAYKCAIRTN